MPYENKFTIRQELPTTYRLVGSGDDLRTAKQKVQNTQNAVKGTVAPPKIKSPTREGGEYKSSATGTTKNRFTADLGEITRRDLTSPEALKGAATGFVLGGGSVIGAAVGGVSAAKDKATTRRADERASRRTAFKESLGGNLPSSGGPARYQAPMNVRTGAQRNINEGQGGDNSFDGPEDRGIGAAASGSRGDGLRG